MLVIGRRVGEALWIAGDITITVQEIRGKHVKLAISAPASVVVARAEIGRSSEVGCADAGTGDGGRRRDGGFHGGQP